MVTQGFHEQGHAGRQAHPPLHRYQWEEDRTTTQHPTVRLTVSEIVSGGYNSATSAPSTHVFSINDEGPAVVPLEPSPAEGQCSEGLVDVGEQFLGSRQTERNVRGVEVLHVVGTIQILRVEGERESAGYSRD